MYVLCPLREEQRMAPSSIIILFWAYYGIILRSALGGPQSIHKSKKEKPKELTKSKEGKQQYLNACKIQRTLSPRCGPSTFQLFVID